jgi:hypothetical protein
MLARLLTEGASKMPTMSNSQFELPSALVQICELSGTRSPIFQPYFSARSLPMIAPVRVRIIVWSCSAGILTSGTSGK